MWPWPLPFYMNFACTYIYITKTFVYLYDPVLCLILHMTLTLNVWSLLFSVCWSWPLTLFIYTTPDDGNYQLVFFDTPPKMNRYRLYSIHVSIFWNLRFFKYCNSVLPVWNVRKITVVMGSPAVCWLFFFSHSHSYFKTIQAVVPCILSIM